MTIAVCLGVGAAVLAVAAAAELIGRRGPSANASERGGRRASETRAAVRSLRCSTAWVCASGSRGPDCPTESPPRRCWRPSWEQPSQELSGRSPPCPRRRHGSHRSWLLGCPWRASSAPTPGWSEGRAVDSHRCADACRMHSIFSRSERPPAAVRSRALRSSAGGGTPCARARDALRRELVRGAAARGARGPSAARTRP